MYCILLIIINRMSYVLTRPFLTHKSKAIKVPIEDYINRWSKYAIDDDRVIIIMLVLFSRIKDIIFINIRTIHRLLASLLIVACKYYYDSPFTNQYYSTVAGLSLADLNYIEESLLTSIEWKVHVSHEEFIDMLDKKNEVIQDIVSII